MDVAFVNRPLGMRRGGGEMWDIEMARALESMGVDVTIYTGQPLTGGLEKPVDFPLRAVRSPFLYDLSYAAPVGIGFILPIIQQARGDTEPSGLAAAFAQVYEFVDVPATLEYIVLGSGMEISIQEFVETIANMTGFEGEIEWDNSKPDCQMRRRLDVSKAKKYFDWEAETDFETELRKTVEWFENHRNDIPHGQRPDHTSGCVE